MDELRQAVVWTLRQWRVAEAKDVLRCLAPDLESHPSTDHQSLGNLFLLQQKRKRLLHLAADMPHSCLLSYLGVLGSPHVIGKISQQEPPFHKISTFLRRPLEFGFRVHRFLPTTSHPHTHQTQSFVSCITMRRQHDCITWYNHTSKFETLFPCILYAVTTDPNPSDFCYRIKLHCHRCVFAFH